MKPPTLPALIATCLLVLVPVHGGAVPYRSQSQSRGVDFEALGQQATELLLEYLRIDTTNPPGNEIRAARFFATRLRQADIPHEVFESAAGRGNVYARLRGDGSRGGGIVLLHHMDVVPADDEYWTTEPFAAEVRNDFVHGRGVLDMKAYGAVQFATFLALEQASVRLGRDVIFLATAGEETGGAEGAGYVVDQRKELLDGVEFVLTEGAYGRRLGDRVVHTAEVTHKTPAWIRLRVTGPAGHGAQPRGDAATHRLIRALERIRTYRGEIKLVPAVVRALRARADYEPDPALADAYRNIDDSIGDPAVLEALGRELEPLLRNTISITVLEGSSVTNVIPPEATAELDCRLLPGENPTAFIATLRDVIDDPAVEIEPILIRSGFESPIDTPLWRAIEAALQARDPDSVLVPGVIPGFTDAHYFRRLGMVAYGWAPFVRVADEGEAHATDERIHVDNVRQGPELLYDIILRLAAVPDGSDV